MTRDLIVRNPYKVFFIRLADSIGVFRVLHEARHDREWRKGVPRHEPEQFERGFLGLIHLDAYQPLR